MSNLVNMVLAAVLNVLNPGVAQVPAPDSVQTTIEAVMERQMETEFNAPVFRFETENC